MDTTNLITDLAIATHQAELRRLAARDTGLSVAPLGRLAARVASLASAVERWAAGPATVARAGR